LENERQHIILLGCFLEELQRALTIAIDHQHPTIVEILVVQVVWKERVLHDGTTHFL
jgi:hypothetical protein